MRHQHCMLAATLPLFAAGAAHAQCSIELQLTTEVYRTIGTRGFPADDVAVVDHDGPGPLAPVMYRSWGDPGAPGTSYGYMTATRLGGLAPPTLPYAPNTYWNSRPRFISIPTPTSNLPGGTLLLLHGPAFEDLGRFDQWDGTTLRPVGPAGFTQLPSCWTTWDPDGDGPQRPLLIVGGFFQTFRGSDARYIAMLSNDGQWQPLGAALPQPVTQLLTHDEDGDGPLRPNLVAVTTAAGWNAWTWDGTQWTQIPTRFEGLVCSHDADGAGPIPPYLYCTGPATSRPPQFSYWDGETQNALATSWPIALPGLTPPAYYGSTVSAMTSYDPDGPGPALPQLVIGGEFYAEFRNLFPTFAVLRGSAWQLVDPGPWGATSGASPGAHRFGVIQMTPFDPDNDGPLGPLLYMTGGLTSLNLMYSADAVSYDGTRFAYSPAFDYPTARRFFVTADLDGPGPSPRRIYVGGRMVSAAGEPCAGLASYAEGSFHAEGSADLTALRPIEVAAVQNDAGVDELFGYGNFVSTSTPTPIIQRYATDRWQGLGQNVTGTFSFAPNISGICRFDPDGPGPQASTLFAVGYTAISALLRWDGTAWVAAGTPRPWGYFDRILVADLDDAGPRPAEMYAIGEDGLLRWSGADWTDVAPIEYYPNGGYFPRAVVFDPDGPGPLGKQIVVCTDQMQPTDYPVMRGAIAWNGTRWQPLSTTSPGEVRHARVIDIDGDGPEPASLLVCTTQGLKVLKNGAWVTLRARECTDVIGYTPGVDGPAPGELFVTETTGEIVYIRPFVMDVRSGPSSLYIREGDSASFAVDAANTVQFRWRRNAVYVTDGPGGAAPDGGTVSGANSATLTITGATCADAGHYDCVVIGLCSQIVTNDALLTFNGCGRCGGDLNQDGSQDQADVATLVNVIAGDVNYDTFDPDFNHDGNVDQDDIDALIRVIAGGECP